MHHHDHDHDHHAHHHHAPQNIKILTTAFVLILVFMCIEFWAGFAFNSLALLADAGHMANDAFSLGLALLALLIAERAKRLSQWIAVMNGVSLMVIAVWIIVEAWQRFHAPAQMLPLPMMMVASLGLVVNLIVAYMMLQADHDNTNIKAAYLHVLADLFGSVVAIISGLAAYFLGWLWVDSVASVILSVVIFRSGWQVTRLAMAAART